MTSSTTFLGYARPDGIRNRLLVLFTVVCAEEVSRRIAYQLDDAVVRLAANPNVGAVLAISLGCESTDAEAIVEAIRATGKPVEFVSIQAAGGTRSAVTQGVEKARALQDAAAAGPRTSIGLADLIVGVEC